MKKQVLIFLLVIVAYTSNYAEFVEQFRSEPKRRFAKALKNVVASDEYSTRDLNGNGVNDRVQIMINSQSGGYLCSVYDGLSKSPYTQFPITFFGDTQTHEVGWLGFYLKGDAPPSLVMYDGEISEGEFIDWSVNIINPSTKAIEYSVNNAKFLGVANIDNDFVPEIFYFDLNTREIVVIEWKEGGTSSVSNSNLLNTKNQLIPRFAKSNLDYTLTLKYESAPKTQLIYDDSFFESVSDFDADGDGIMDLSIAVENDSQQTIGLIVIDGTSKNIKWAFQYPENQLNEFSNFRGFYDVDGSGVKEAIFGKGTVVTADKNVYSLNQNFELITAYDVDNDGYPDLIGIGLQDSTVQVWGIESPSGVVEKDLTAAGFQLKQNYPNPFNPTTKISWQSPVGSWQTLKVYDVLGTEVAALVNEYKSAGSYEVDFDASQLSSGVYFYKLQTSSFTETKKMILLR